MASFLARRHDGGMGMMGGMGGMGGSNVPASATFSSNGELDLAWHGNLQSLAAIAGMGGAVISNRAIGDRPIDCHLRWI